MRPRTVAAVLASALVLAACGGDPAEPAEPTSAAAADPTSPSAEPTTDATATEPTETSEAPADTSEPAEPAVELLLELPAEAMLAQDALEPVGQERGEVDGPARWSLSSACGVEPSGGLVAMRTVSQGLYESLDPVGIQQVAVFATVDDAVAEADRLGAQMEACTADPPAESGSYRLEEVTVGAQGRGLANNYAALGDDAEGTYSAVTRRGNAVTVVTLMSGASSVGEAREMVTSSLGRAFDALCLYDSTGC